MNTSFKSFASRKKNLKYGSYSAGVVAITATFLIIATLILEALDFTADLTVNKMYTPSQDTIRVLDELQDDIDIFGLYQTGTETYSGYAESITIMEQYARYGKRVEYKTIDTLKHPDFVKQYLTAADSAATVANGNVLVVNKRTGKYRMLTIYDFYDYMNSDSTSVDSFVAEEALTTAIQYVTAEVTPTLYQLINHGEAVLDKTFESYMITTNYAFENVNLEMLGKDTLDVNTSVCYMINNPQTDLSEFEYTMLMDYMERGGRLIVLLSNESTQNLVNLKKLLQRYGVDYSANGIAGDVVIEQSATHYYNVPFYIYTDPVKEAGLVKNLAENHVVRMYAPIPLTLTELSNRNTKQEVFLKSYDTAMVVSGGEAPFILGVQVSEEMTVKNTVAETRLVVLGESYFIDENNYVVTTGNYRLMSSVLNYMQDESSLYFSGKSLTTERRENTTEWDLIKGLAIFAVLIPAAIIIAGTVIHVRRKKA